MSTKSSSDKLAAYNDALFPLLEELRKAFTNVVNGKGDIAEFSKAMENLNEFRQFINSAENIGFIVGIDQLRIAVFHLTGNTEKDIDQIAMNLQKTKMN